MRQFVLPDEYTGGPELVLRGKSHHYLARVLRLHAGDAFAGLDAHGNPVSITIEAIDAASAKLRIAPGDRPDAPELGLPRITLYQCLPKGRVMDHIVRQAVEAGVQRIVPVLSEHSVARPSVDEASARARRWSRIVREALQQSGTRTIPVVAPLMPFDAIPADHHGSGLFFHERPLAHKTIHEYLVRNPDEISLVVGPEGGLSEQETELLADAGFGAAYLGRSVLRVETAALFAIAAVLIVLLERDSWKA